MTWTQPICTACWDARNPGRRAVRLIETGDTETCCYCGIATRSGIYVRVDPASVPHPRS